MKIKIWDMPTRVFHWTLVLVYAGAFFFTQSEWYLEYHTVAGYIALGLVAFRFLWGFAGTKYSRFSDFINGWGEVKGYVSKALKMDPPRYLGHNPAVGWVVLAMLFLTAVISVTGIITYSGEEQRGAWGGHISIETALAIKEVHEFSAYLAIVLIVVHICAALFHDFVLRENIILSMVTGYKEDEGTWKERTSSLGPGEGRSVARLAVWLIVTLMAGAAFIYLPPEKRSDFTDYPMMLKAMKGQAVELAPSAAWKAECAESCHNAFHPALLPAESWRKVMAGLDDHFGETIELDDAAQKEIEGFLTSASAESSYSEASIKILRSLKKGEAPARITDVPYWKKKHADIKEDVFSRKSVVSKSNCVACHPGAEAGSFEDKDIKVPD